MIRAIFFDFYSVWTPDKIGYYLAAGQLNGPEDYKILCDTVESYYLGKIDIKYLADTFKFKLGHPDLSEKMFELHEQNISSGIIDFMRSLHGHFFKLGVLANLGLQELKLINDFNLHNQIFEVIASPLSYKLNVPLQSKEMIDKALEDIQEPITNALYVSGNLPLLEFANFLGMAVIQFEGFDKLKSSIDKLISSEIPT